MSEQDLSRRPLLCRLADRALPPTPTVALAAMNLHGIDDYDDSVSKPGYFLQLSKLLGCLCRIMLTRDEGWITR